MMKRRLHKKRNITKIIVHYNPKKVKFFTLKVEQKFRCKYWYYMKKNQLKSDISKYLNTYTLS